MTVRSPAVLELRVALTTQDFDRLAAFYRQGLGLEWSRPRAGRRIRAGLWSSTWEGLRSKSLTRNRRTLSTSSRSVVA